MSALEDRAVDAHDLALVLDGLEILSHLLWTLVPATDAYMNPLAEVDGLVEQVRGKYDIPSSPSIWK